MPWEADGVLDIHEYTHLHHFLECQEQPRLSSRQASPERHHITIQPGQSWKPRPLWVPGAAALSHLSGVRLFPFSFTSRSSSEESTGEVVLASKSSCSCWARYWAGFCLASLAQWRSSRCNRGRLAYRSMIEMIRHTVRFLVLSGPSVGGVGTRCS